jgi:hypothetical protein
MNVTHSPRWTRAALPAVVVIALGAGLAGCRNGAVAVTSGPAASAGGTTSAGGTASAEGTAGSGAAAAATEAQDAGSGPSPAASAEPGSVTVSVSAPVTVSGTVAVPVSCATGVAYRATVSSAVVQGDQLSYTVAIPRYTGPGRYYTVVGVTLRQASGVVTAVGRVSSVPAAITAAGGSFTVSAVGSGGRTLAGSLSWTCGA